MLYQFFFLILNLSLIQGFHFRSLQGKSSPKTKPSPSPYSIPADDNDIDSRNSRRNQRTKNWSTRKYSQYDKYFNYTDLVNSARNTNYPETFLSDDFQFVAPTGLLGSSQVAQETIFIAVDQLGVRSQDWGNDIPAVYGTVLAQGGFPTLQSFLSAYNALPVDKRPTSASFYDSDVAFAARYLTSSPLFIKKISAASQIPFDTSSINGLSDIIAPSTLDGLIRSGKLFIIDFTVFGFASGDQASGSVAEAPIGLFFVDKNSRLMPLAIKFTIQNTITYSPKDSHADWFLAKAVFNMIDLNALGLVHFIDVHFTLSHICQSLQQSLAAEHPLYALLTVSCSKNDGIIQNGLPSLLSDGGAFDSLLGISGRAIRTRLLKNIGATFDWSKKGLDFDLTNRDVRGIPNYDYATDATKLYQIISTFVSSYLSSYYRADNRLAGDSELSNFISKLSSASSPLKINGFPSSVTTISSLVEIASRVIFMAGVQHHTLNSYNIKNYFLVYPHSPGKIPGIPPAKNLINDDYLKNNILMFGLPVTSFAPFFLGTIQLDYLFAPVLGATGRLDSAFFIPTSDGKVDAFVQMRNSLNDLSNAIQARAVKDTNDGLVPPYVGLDPVNLPFGSAI